jgi:methionyl-tRNA formyltransferase
MYMGTPDFAVPALDALCGSGHVIVCVVTQPDRPRGRGHRVSPSPVKARASELGLKVLQPESVRDSAEWDAALAEARPDLIVVCAYGRILPEDTLSFPRLGCVNIHASLLPKYRGAAPVHRAIEAGESESGVTLMHMSKRMDEGDMIASRSVPIRGMNSGEALEVLAKLGAGLLTDELPSLVSGTARREPQDDAMATYAPPVRREEGHVDFAAAPGAIIRKILAMTPSPGAYAFLGEEKIKILEARVLPEDRGGQRPGEVTDTDGGVIAVAAGGGGSVGIVRMQSSGGRPVNAADWLRGHSIEPGSEFV